MKVEIQLEDKTRLVYDILLQSMHATSVLSTLSTVPIPVSTTSIRVNMANPWSSYSERKL